MIPKTGSTVCLLSPYFLRPSEVISLRAVFTSQSVLGSMGSLADVGRKSCRSHRPAAPVATYWSTPMASARSTCFSLK